jgi:hypothetical protein
MLALGANSRLSMCCIVNISSPMDLTRVTQQVFKILVCVNKMLTLVHVDV